jgi:hypothetical protein
MRRSRGAALLAFMVLVGGCDEDPTGPSESPVETHTVDASDLSAWAFVRLGTPPTTVSTAATAPSGAWDLAFQRTAIHVNGGGSSGDVATYCICQNAAATSDEYQAMTPATELSEFEEVTAADIPAAASWDTGATEAAVFATSSWYRYNLTGEDHLIWPTYDVYLVRSGSEVYKVQFIGYYGPAGEDRQITFRSSRISG